VEGVQQRINALPPAARKALIGAAIFGRRISPSLLAPVVDSTEEQVLDALGAAWRAGIIKQNDEGGYRFSHDVIREVVEAAIEPPRRTLLHRRVAETLEKLPEHRGERAPAVLAWHFGQGGEPTRALTYSMQAGNAAQATFANAAAAEHFGMAAELAAGLVDQKRYGEALEKQGTALRVLGKYHAALNRLDAALEAYGMGRDDHGRGRVVGQIARAHWYEGSFPDGIERIDRFLASIHGATHPPLLADLYGIRAGLLEASGRYREGLSSADYAADLIRKQAESRASSGDLAAIEVRRGALLLAMGCQKEASEVLEAALSLAEGVGDLRLVGSILERLSASHDSQAGPVDLKQAVARREQSLDVLERVGNSADIAVSLSSLASYQARLGRWDKARCAIEHAVTLAGSTEPSWMTAGVLICAGWIYLQAGSWAKARHNLQKGIDLGERARWGANGMEFEDGHGEDLNRLLHGQAGLALLETFEGAPEEARKRCQALLEGVASHAPPASLLLCALALAHTNLGDIVQARAVVAEAVERAAEQGGKSWRVLPEWVRGIVLAQGGHCDEALRALDDALTMARDRWLLWDEAMILETLGHTRLGMGDVGTGRTRLLEALAVFHKFGGGSHAARVKHTLAPIRWRLG
jgi:tetratricopeptide (TPR) repeat protein